MLENIREEGRIEDLGGQRMNIETRMRKGGRKDNFWLENSVSY